VGRTFIFPLYYVILRLPTGKILVTGSAPFMTLAPAILILASRTAYWHHVQGGISTLNSMVLVVTPAPSKVSVDGHGLSDSVQMVRSEFQILGQKGAVERRQNASEPPALTGHKTQRITCGGTSYSQERHKGS
jgi:hypothetical protein